MSTPDLPSPIALEEIFRVAAELPAEERAAYLETVCEGRPEMRARIERMREVGGIAALLQQGGNETVPAEIETELARLKPEEDGERMGNYKLLQQIGEGGFGDQSRAPEGRHPSRHQAAQRHGDAPRRQAGGEGH